MEVDPLVIAIFGPPPEGIDLSANSEAKNAAVVLTLLFTSALFLAGRIAIRTQQVYGLSLDDYAIIISWVFVAATGAMVVVVGQAGAGKHFKGTEGTCIDVGHFFVILAIINLITNVIVLLIPVPEVLKLQMSMEKKAAVFGILALGGLVCIASAVRVHYLDVFAKAADNTWAMGTVAIWSSVEPSMGIVSACLPSFKSFLRHLRRRSGSKSRSSFPTISNGAKGNRLRFDDEIALRSQVVAGEGSMHSGQGSEAGRQIYVKTDVEQVITEIPESMRRSDV
ncbi:integral membrane protein [Fusarium beomiforme]|uniref:Integral membrane protein n=1 Tax=Fusarium beomiforme TaxID=44412 RepID=A0A9P5DUD9_9HYPO|nr:integral membrane protein [Fusarium beomiforme]